MAGNVSLLLVYEVPGGRPLTVARVDNSSLLLDAAQTAILQAEQRADALSEADEVLGRIERSEANRLRQVLALLIPGVLATKSGPQLLKQ